MAPTKRRITAILSLPLLLGAAPAVSLACGYHDPLVLAQGMLNWSYPDSLHVTGAVWSAQQQGVLAMPDAERILARGSERERLEKEAFWKATRAIHQLGDTLGAIESQAAGGDLAFLLVSPMLWTRFVPADEGVAVHSHADGAEPGDLVIITDEPVLHAIEGGTLSIAKASEMGLLRLYGEPEHQRAFLQACGHIGDEPLPEISQRDLLRRIRMRPQESSSGDAQESTRRQSNRQAEGGGPIITSSQEEKATRP